MALWQAPHSSFTPYTTGEARHSSCTLKQMNTEPQHCNTLNHTHGRWHRAHTSTLEPNARRWDETHWTTCAISGLCKPPLTLCQRLHARKVEHTDASRAIREPVRQHRELSLALSPDDTTGSAVQVGKGEWARTHGRQCVWTTWKGGCVLYRCTRQAFCPNTEASKPATPSRHP
jgi:hypothetical protein